MVSVRPASQPGDLAFVQQLEGRFGQLGLLGWDDTETHRERMQGADARYLIFEHLGEAVGFAIVCGLASVNRNIELKRLAVSEPGRGVGRAALRQIIDAAFGEWNAHRLWLDVFTDNLRARRVYQALGFIEEGTLRECCWDGSSFRSMVLMSQLEHEYRALKGTT